MNLLPQRVQQWLKASRVRELSLRVAPPPDTDGLAYLEYGRQVTPSIRWEALDDFIDFCETDAELREVLEASNLDRKGFKELYMHLAAMGLNQWVDDHLVALSTLAYPESLVYVLQSRRLRMDPADVRASLLRYWTGVATHGRDPDAARLFPQRRSHVPHHARP